MMTETAEVKATPAQIRAITIEGMAKVPNQKWEKDINGEPRPVVTVSLVIKDISDRDLRRLAQAALSEIPLDIEITPRLEQEQFDLDS